MAQAMANIGDMIRNATHDQVKVYIRCIFVVFFYFLDCYFLLPCMYSSFLCHSEIRKLSYLEM
jgi:hypothetical protein